MDLIYSQLQSPGLTNAVFIAVTALKKRALIFSE